MVTMVQREAHLGEHVAQQTLSQLEFCPNIKWLELVGGPTSIQEEGVCGSVSAFCQSGGFY